MRSTLFRPAWNDRRTVLALVLGVMLIAASATALASRQGAAQPQTPAMTFDSSAGMILYSIKAEGAADFEGIITKLKEALAKTEDATRKSQAQGWKVFKAAEAAPGEALYVFLMDPVVKGADYNWAKMFEGLPREDLVQVNQLFEKFRAAVIRANKLNLNNVATFAPSAGLVPGAGK